MKENHGFRLEVSGPDVAYLRLPAHDGAPGSVARSVMVTSGIEGYQGADVVLDLDSEGRLLGVEIVD